MRELTPKISSPTALAMTRYSKPARRAEIRRGLEADDRNPDTINDEGFYVCYCSRAAGYASFCVYLRGRAEVCG